MPEEPVEDDAEDVEAEDVEEGIEKARRVPGVDKVRAKVTAGIRRDVDKVLALMRKDIAAKVESNAEHLARKPKDDKVWWDEKRWVAELTDALKPHAALAAESAYTRTSAMLDRASKADMRDAILARLLRKVGLRVKDIAETTRQKVRAATEEGIAEGMGAAQLGKLVSESAAFGEYRGELIARTETNHVLNAAQLESYREYEVEKVQAYDGDDDPECAARNGQVYTVEEASAIQDHPNGTLDWAPYLYQPEPAKAAPVVRTKKADEPAVPIINVNITLPEALVMEQPKQPDVYVTVEPSPAPSVNVNVEPQPAPVVNVTTPDVTVNVPEQAAPVVNVEAAKAVSADPAMVYVVNMPTPKRAVLERSRDTGKVTGARIEEA
jgi:SPP1 gp7 family putative phage head morphogenesis protein